MDSQRCKSVGWANLPPELLTIISGGLGNPADISRFRWVCRSWRLSTSPPANKLSPFFPLVLHYSVLQPRRRVRINASAVYLIRPRHDLSKAWMVSLEESVGGELVLRHAVTYAKIPGNLPDDNDWIVTQVARSYAHNILCERCNGIRYTEKVAVVTNNNNNNNNSMGGLCRTEDFRREMFAFELGSSGEEEARVIHLDLDCGYRPIFADFVKFNGWIYAVDYTGCVFVVDRDKSRLHLVCSGDLRRYKEYNDAPYNIRLVASDGDLYVVFSRWWIRFRIYRLVASSSSCSYINNGMITSGKWKRVKDLGDRVFFIAKNCSFSISATDLPRPWKGNSLVALEDAPFSSSCECRGIIGRVEEDRVALFFVGGKLRARVLNHPMHLLQGYSDLFAAPNLLNAKKKKKKKKDDHIIF